MTILHLFFGWPDGGTWSNMIASAEWVIVAAFLLWLFRDRIGRRLVRWWHKHHQAHLAELAEKYERTPDPPA